MASPSDRPMPAGPRSLLSRFRPDVPVWLWLLAAVAAAPLLALSVRNTLLYHATGDGPTVIQARAATDLLKNAAGAVQTELRDSAALLAGLAAAPGGKCIGLLDGGSWPGGIALFSAEGEMRCGSGVRSGDAPVSVAGQAFLRAALLRGPGVPVLAGAPRGWITGRPATVMALALPPARPDGPSPGVLALGMPLEWLQSVRGAGGTRPTLGLLDARDLTLLGGPPARMGPLGGAVSWPAVLAQVRRGESGGIARLHDPESQLGMVGWRRLNGVGGQPVVLAVSWPVSEEQLDLAPGVFGLLWQAELSLALGLAAAWLLLGRPLVGRLRELGRGRPLGHGGPAMLGAVSARLSEHAVQEAEWANRLGEAQAELRLLTDGAGEMFETLAPDGTRRRVYGASELLLGYPPQVLVQRLPEQDRPPEDWQQLCAALRQLDPEPGATGACETRVRRADRGLIWLEVRLRRLEDGGVLLVSRDASRRRHSEQALAEADRRLATLALEDPLTGLANGRRFDGALAQELRRAARGGGRLGLVLIELDGAAGYRERQGDVRADASLRRMARAAAVALLRPGDLAARLEGDRLALLLPEVDVAGAELVARRLLGAVEAMQIEDTGAPGGVALACAGIAVAAPGAPAATAADLLAAAEAALLRAAEEGGNRVGVAREV